MKKNWRNKVGWTGLARSLVLAAFMLVGCQSANENKESRQPANPNGSQPASHNHAATAGGAEADTYTCPMHPQIVQEKPGSCPICGMDLVKRVAVQAGTGDNTLGRADLKALLQPTNALVVANIATVHPQRRSQPVEIQADGVINYDTRRLYTIPARFGGRIEKLYVRYNYQPIRRGQKLLELYSPDLVTAQRELLYLLSADADNAPLIAAAKQKLRLLGVTEGQLITLDKTRSPSYSLAVFSPYDGYVVTELVSLPTAGASSPAGTAGSGASGSMNSSRMGTEGTSVGTDEIVFNSSTPGGPGGGGSAFLREGQYVQTGQTLFRVVNNNRLWAEFKLYARDATGVKPGDPLTISFDQSGQNSQLARVNFVVPFLENGSSFVTIRAYLPGGRNERIGQLAHALIQRPATDGLWLPATAVLDLGNEQVAFVQADTPGTFRPVRVKVGPRSVGLRSVGPRSTGQVAITDGLTEAQTVAQNAQFLIDSESFVKTSQRPQQP